MRKILFLSLVMALILSCVGLVACGSGGDEGIQPEVTTGPEVTTQPEITTQPEVTTEPQGPAPDKELGAILDKAEGIHCFQYQSVMSGPSVPSGSVTSDIWWKDGKMRTEMKMGGMSTVMITDTEAGKAYSITGGIVQEIPLPADAGAGSAVNQAEALAKYNPTIVGTDTIDGKSCTVMEYTTEGVKTKMWVWTEKGFPLKIEGDSPDGTMTIEFKNVSFDCAPDSMFELPEGAEPQTMPGIPNVPNIPNMPQ